MAQEMVMMPMEGGAVPGAVLQGVQKSAILLLCLEDSQAQEILLRLPAESVQELRAAMASLRQVAPEQRLAVIRECHQALARPALAPALAAPSDPPVTASPLAGWSAQDLLGQLHDEHPQLVSAVLSVVPIDAAAECLQRLPMHSQIDVIRRIATLQPLDSTIIEAVTGSIAPRLERAARHRREGCLLAQVLEETAAPISATEPDVPEDEPECHAAEATGFVLDDLLALDAAHLRMVLEEVDVPAIALALNMASRRLRLRVLESLPSGTAREVAQQVTSPPPMRLADVEAAQATILRVLHRLEAAGEVSLGDRARRNRWA